jgi:PAS domain-containing protein
MHVDRIKQALSNATSYIEELDELLSLFFDSLPDPIFVIDEDGCFIRAFGRNLSYIEHGSENYEGKSLENIFCCSLVQKFELAIREAINTNQLVLIEYEVNSDNLISLDTDMPANWFEGRIYPIRKRGEDKRAVLWIAINKTENKLMEQKLLHLAETDPLTGAYNRRYFKDRY